LTVQNMKEKIHNPAFKASITSAFMADYHKTH